MLLLAVGLNHHTAPVDLREQIAIGPERAVAALHDLRAETGVTEAALLSTCNRTELYCRLPPEALHKPVSWLHHYHRLNSGRLEPFLYRHQDREAVRHMIRVAAGLDSMVLGEPEILGQMKQAYHLAREAASLDSVLDRLFQHTFATAKQVRTSTSIGREPVSVAFAAITLARRLFGSFNDKTVLFIGAGETVELAAQHLTGGAGVDHLVVANRTLARAQELAHRYVGTAIGLDALPEHLGKADLILSSTGAPEAVVTRAMMEAAVARRRRKPVFVVDLAVPRDFEASISEMEDVYLYTVDDLGQVIDAGLKRREAAAEEADSLIDLQVSQYMRWLKAQEAIDLIRDYRLGVDGIRAELLEKAKTGLSAGQPADEVLERFAHQLTRRLLHAPTRRLREAGEQGRNELLEAAREILDLGANEKNNKS